MAFRHLFVLLFAAALSAGAQAPLSPPVPLAPPAPAWSPGMIADTLSAAQRAQEIGLSSVAAQHYGKLLDVPGVDQEGLTLALATVLLDEGNPADAEQVLQRFSGPRNAAWHLRAALAAAQQKKTGATRAEFDAIRPAELGRDDRPWFDFLQGMLTMLEDTTADGKAEGKANIFFQQALNNAPSQFVRTRFELALELTRMRLRNIPSDAELEVRRQSMERWRGQPTGYDSARLLAVGLEMAGRKGRAIEVLQDQLLRLPPNDTARTDDFRFLLGVIGGAADGAGRYALIQLLQRGSDLGKQRIALQLLARASTTQAAREQFRNELDRLIMLQTPPAFLEEAYLFRALVSLSLKNYARAEDDARALLEKFPGSPLLAHAYGVLMASAWEQLRFRVAADNAAKARSLAADPARAELGVVIAEARFRAGQSAQSGGASGAEDFRLAAQAYAEALLDPPPGRPIADLMYQRVLAEIESGALNSAERLIDEMARAVPDPIKRWQAEWNLAWALQSDGKSADALARVNRLLLAKGPDTLALPIELRGRMAWLQAKLSFDVEPSEQTLKLLDSVGKAIEGMEEGQRNEIASQTALLKAETFFALHRDDEAFTTLAQLRKDFPKSDAAILSYMKEADRYAEQDKAIEAQKRLITLAHDYPTSSYAPLALFKAATQAERLGTQAGYAEAARRIEELITLLDKNQKDPTNSLLFKARMKQGDVFRSLGQFPQAQDAYQNLCDNFPQRQDVILAYLALAECHHAQAASDPSHADKAAVLFEHLNLGLDVPSDVRVEAGCSYAELLVARGNETKALEVWWRDVVHAFLDDPAKAASLGATGRLWMSRSLVKMGELLERQHKLEEAKKAWGLIVLSKLPGQKVARQQLERYNVPTEGRQ